MNLLLSHNPIHDNHAKQESNVLLTRVWDGEDGITIEYKSRYPEDSGGFLSAYPTNWREKVAKFKKIVYI